MSRLMRRRFSIICCELQYHSGALRDYSECLYQHNAIVLCAIARPVSIAARSPKRVRLPAEKNAQTALLEDSTCQGCRAKSHS